MHEVQEGLTDVSERPADAQSALRTLEATAGAVHRLAWEGEDPDEDRRRALAWFNAAAVAVVGTHPRLGAVLDWWRVAALGAEPLHSAWSIDRELPGELGDVLHRILVSGGGRPLDAVRRPAAFSAVLDQLERVAERNPGKIAAEKEILTEAISECHAVLRAAVQGGPKPTKLRLASATPGDLAAWASEGSAARRVDPNTPVWNHLIKQLETRRQLVQRALALWPGSERPAPELPAAWKKSVDDHCEAGRDLAKALVEDALPEPSYRPILAPGTLLAKTLAKPPEGRQRVAFVLTREAAASAGREPPEWAAVIADRVQNLADRLDGRLAEYEGEAAEDLGAAQQALDRLELAEAENWIEQADRDHEAATQGADLVRIKERAEFRAAELSKLGFVAPAPGPDLHAWAEAVDARWREARAPLREAVEHVLQRALRVPSGAEAVVEAAEEAQRALQRNELAEVAQLLHGARRELEACLDQERERLGPELWALAERIDALPEAGALTLAIERAASRRAAGLASERLVEELAQLAEILASGAPAATVAVEAKGGARRLAYVLAGIEAPGTAAVTEAGPAGLRLTPGAPDDASHHLSAWGELWSNNHLRADALGPVFRRTGSAVEGPFRLLPTGLAPEEPAFAVARLPIADFERLFGRIIADETRSLVPDPPTLEDLVAAGASVHDRLDDVTAAAWLARQLEQTPSPESLRRFLADDQAPQFPPSVYAIRASRLRALLPRAEALDDARRQAVAAWLETKDGEAARSEAAARWVADQLDRHEAEVRARRAELDAELAAKETALVTVAQRVAEEEKRLGAEIERLESELAAARSALEDEKVRLLAQLGAFGGAERPRGGGAREAARAPIRARPFRPGEPPALEELITAVAGSTWDRTAVANLVLSLGTGRWTLLAGLPGVGKSTFVRSVLSRLGHGPGSDRYLELVVRRDWQDDAALFGFWHPTEHRWTASSEGFVEHLLRARDGEADGGLWPVLVEELNLASPEYYLARMLSAFEAAAPTVRLYDPELDPDNAERYPWSFSVPPSVRMLATINVDDTVERLSPRFLSRASVLWMEPSADAPLWRAEDDNLGLSVPWSALAPITEAAALGGITEVVKFLQEARVPGAPTARTRRAMERYLGAADGVLDRTEAEDLQVLQRVLPPLRGVGPRWRTLLDQLGALFEERGWRRSAARTKELRVRGEELGDWYDFFHT